MTSQTKTTITNLALRELGSTRIADYDEVSATAAIVRDVWEQGVRKALARAEWEFATKAARLTQSAVDVGGYAYKYQLPTDFIRLGSVYDDESMDSPMWDTDFKRRGGYLETDEAKLYIDYVYYHDTPGGWPAWFVDVFVADLAGVLASPLKSSTERDRLEQLATSRLRDGKSADGAQKPTMMLPPSRWIRGMKGGSSFDRRYGGKWRG